MVQIQRDASCEGFLARIAVAREGPCCVFVFHGPCEGLCEVCRVCIDKHHRLGGGLVLGLGLVHLLFDVFDHLVTTVKIRKFAHKHW